ncbi:hypothetical protein KSS87_005892, partial [Heliosperma pusillum]
MEQNNRRTPNRIPITDPKIRQVGFTTATTTTPPPQQPPYQNPNNLPNIAPVIIPSPYFNPAETSSAVNGGGDDGDGGDDGGESVDSGEAYFSEGWTRRSSSGKFSLGFDMSGVNSPVTVDGNVNNNGNGNGNHDEVELSSFNDEKGGCISEAGVSHNDLKPASKPLKKKPSKAERRALQEAQRAAKAAQKEHASRGVTEVTEKPAKVPKQQALQKKIAPSTASSMVVSEMKTGDRSSEKERKKDIPAPRMQYDDKSRVDKVKKRFVVKKTEVKNRVELFRHLPQYEYENQLSDLESKYFEHVQVHPAVFKVGLQHLAGNITGSNARCIAMLYSFKEAIEDYHTPPQKTLSRDLTARISNYISYLNECRPLSISMGNAIRFLKTRIAKLPISVTESEAKTILFSEIDLFVNEKIIIANKVIVNHTALKIRDGDVLLTYGCFSVVEMALINAHELGKKFRVIIIDSRPKLEGQGLLRRLVRKGLKCTYTHINAVSYVMHEVTKVLLGAASVFSNGTVYSRIGTACVAM